MDELLSEERKRGLIETFMDIAGKDILTNMDALLIIEILDRACKRKKAEMYEDIMTDLVEGGDGE